jgi:hypothetical protein
VIGKIGQAVDFVARLMGIPGSGFCFGIDRSAAARKAPGHSGPFSEFAIYSGHSNWQVYIIFADLVAAA